MLVPHRVSVAAEPAALGSYIQRRLLVRASKWRRVSVFWRHGEQPFTTR